MDDVQAAICDRFGVEFCPSPPDAKLGLALETISQRPINGLRHPPMNGTSGWYVWAGETFSYAEDFFQPVHENHLQEILPSIIPYLGLPPGWRFQVAPGYEDVWFDATLLDES